MDTSPFATEPVSPIEDMHQFAHLMKLWHHQQMSQLDHMQNIPSGEVINVQLEEGVEGEDLTLEGDVLKGFKAAIVIAMNLFHELPFGAVPIEDKEDGTTPVN